VAIAAVSRLHITMLTGLAMLAFAGNSLLCRLALKNTAIDAASFTSIRLVAAAITLWLLVRAGNKSGLAGGNWLSALALFAYAAGFSFAYINLTAATGALLLFGAVQITMVSYGIAKGERLLGLQLMGLTLALGGLVGLLLPGLAAPPLVSSVLMIGAGMAWGVYSLRGRGAGDPAVITAGNFLRTIPVTLTLSLVMVHHVSLDSSGIIYAILSGAVTSGMGYAIWYKALPALQATHAATVQLSVPVIAALGGIILLGETLTLRFVLASLAILCGIAMVIFEKAKSKNA
jgi:drug/metabolite transporter (DMT)-like permease